MTDLDAAPDSLLKFVCCKCKLSSKHPCSTNICSCHKHGLKCVTACKDCHGEGCNNSEEIVIDDTEEEANTTSDLQNTFSVCLIFNTYNSYFSCQMLTEIRSINLNEKIHLKLFLSFRTKF